MRPAPTPRPRYGQRAFGHTRDRTQLVDDEATAIREAAQRVLNGDTHTMVVGDWNRRGLRTTAGGPWRVNTLSALLVQERLLGARHPDGSPASPAIFDRETHDRLVALRRSRGKGVRRPPVRYLLTGLLICWRCGSRLCGMKSCNKRMYVCQPPGHGGCSGTFVQADAIDVIVRQMVADHVDSSGFALSLAERRRWLEANVTDLQDFVTEIADRRLMINDLDEMWLAGTLSRVRWADLKSQLERRISRCEARLAPLLDLQPMIDLAGTGAGIVANWDSITFEEQRRLLDIVVDHFIVLPARGRQNRFAERLRPVWRA